MKTKHKFLLITAVAAIIMTGACGCNIEDNEVENDEVSNSLDLLGEYNEDDEYLTASIFAPDVPESFGPSETYYTQLESKTNLPDFPQEIKVDKTSTVYTVMEIKREDRIEYEDYEFKFTYGEYEYTLRYSWAEYDNESYAEYIDSGFFDTNNSMGRDGYSFRVGVWRVVIFNNNSYNMEEMEPVKENMEKLTKAMYESAKTKNGF